LARWTVVLFSGKMNLVSIKEVRKCLE